MVGNRFLAILAAVALAVVLAGCGGGSGAGVSQSQGSGAAVSSSSLSSGLTGNAVASAEGTTEGGPGSTWEAYPPVWVMGDADRAVAYNPTQIRTAYGISAFSSATGITGAGQTIAIVDAYGSPTLQNDFNVFCKQYGLPVQTLGVAYPSGRPATTDAGWAMETNLDVQWAHAVAPGATIIVVVAKSASYTDLIAAVDYAVTLRANVVSMSWGGSEFSTETLLTVDGHFQRTGVTFVAASGDNGAGTMWPAVSSNVLAVGGSTLTLNASSVISSETAWRGSGGGRSTYVAEPAFQVSSTLAHPVAKGKRAVPDVAYDGDPATGFLVYDTTPINGSKGWFVVGGTSAGAPQWAGLVALANQQRLVNRKAVLGGAAATAIYRTTGCLRDVTAGSNGYSATAGFDLVTGLGTPIANRLLPALIAY